MSLGVYIFVIILLFDTIIAFRSVDNARILPIQRMNNIQALKMQTDFTPFESAALETANKALDSINNIALSINSIALSINNIAYTVDIAIVVLGLVAIFLWKENKEDMLQMRKDMAEDKAAMEKIRAEDKAQMNRNFFISSGFSVIASVASIAAIVMTVKALNK